MITVEELKAKFAVCDVEPYGSCIVIPGAEFDPDWEVFLGDQGYKCFFVDLDRKPVTLVRLKKDAAKETRRQPVAPWMNPEGRWRPEEDQLIIDFWNKKLKVAKICEKVCSKFPKRTDKAVINRIHRLVKSGKISARLTRKDKEKPARLESEPATPTSTLLIKLTKDVSEILDILDIQNQVIDKLLCTVLMQGLQIKEQRGEFTIPPGLWIHYANALLEEDKQHCEKFRFKVKQLLEASS